MCGCGASASGVCLRRITSQSSPATSKGGHATATFLSVCVRACVCVGGGVSGAGSVSGSGYGSVCVHN